MAYVYNQNKEDEVPQSGSNIFNAQPQPGAQPDSSAVSKTGDTGIMGAGGGTGGGPEKTAEQVQQRSAQRRQAAFPLREIFKRNTAAQVGAPDFSKTSNAIAQAGTALQNAANAYTASNVSAVPTIDQSTINTYAGIVRPERKIIGYGGGDNVPIFDGPPVEKGTSPALTYNIDPNAAQEAGNKITSAITPRSAALTKFELPKEANLPTENELTGRFNTSSGLTNEILQANPVVGQSRGAAGLDTAFLQGNTAFQKSKDAILASGKEAIGKQNTLLATLPETTRVAAQAAIDDAAKNARELLKTTAGGYETDAKTRQAAFETTRTELKDRIDKGNLSDAMKAQILAEYDKQQGMSPDFRKFLSDPNRMGLASSLGKDITDYGGTVGDLSSFSDANLAGGFRLADTPTDLTSFMSDDQYNPYAKISSLLGKDTTRAAAATTQPLTYDATNLSNARKQFDEMNKASTTGRANFDRTRDSIGEEIGQIQNVMANELRRYGERGFTNEQIQNSGNLKRAVNDVMIKYFGEDGNGGIAKSLNLPVDKIKQLKTAFRMPDKLYSEKEINDSYIQPTDAYVRGIVRSNERPTVDNVVRQGGETVAGFGNAINDNIISPVLAPVGNAVNAVGNVLSGKRPPRIF